MTRFILISLLLLTLVDKTSGQKHKSGKEDTHSPKVVFDDTAFLNSYKRIDSLYKIYGDSLFLFIDSLKLETLFSKAYRDIIEDKAISSTSPSLQQIFWDNLPKPKGYINDYENLYADTEETTLDSLIADFEKKTTIQFAIVTIDTLLTTKDQFDALTLKIANEWGVGQKGKDNGILVGISRGYKRMRIQNGYGIEKILSDSETKQIVDAAFIPSFRNGEYFQGTLNGLKALMETLKKKPQINF